MITEQKMMQALAILTDPDSDYAKARAAHEFAVKMEKVLLSQIADRSEEKSMAAKENWARYQPEYQQALEQTKEIAEMDYRNRARREAAMAIVETWRTEQSNERAHTRVSNVTRAA